MVLFYLAAAAIAVILFHLFVFHQYNYPWIAKIIDKIPGPEGVFYFGSTLHYWQMKNEDRMEAIVDSFKVYGTTYRQWFSGVPIVFISELDDFQTVLSSRVSSEKGIMYKHIIPWLGRGLLTSKGNTWHTRRKIITPTFHFSILQSFVDIFNRNTTTMLNKLSKAAKEDKVDLNQFVTLCTLDNVCETAMGTFINSQGEENSYVNGVLRIGAIAAERMFSPVLFKDLNFALSALGREHQRILKALHGFTYKVIRECKEANKTLSMTKEANVTNDDNDVGVYKNRMSFLQLLLEKQNEYKLTNTHIREEVDTFMFEGHDTTSFGITWTLMELGCHPEIQERCFEEQQQIFGADDRMPTYTDVMKMHYLKRVIQESLRLHPSVPLISRKFSEDLQLKDYLIPAGTEIVMCLFHHHRNPTVFPDPEKFDPDRFLPETANSRHKFAYVPFSAGLRNCVGQKFAMMELLIILGSIIRKFKIKSLDKRESIKVVPEMTLRPYQRLSWKITQRTSV